LNEIIEKTIDLVIERQVNNIIESRYKKDRDLRRVLSNNLEDPLDGIIILNQNVRLAVQKDWREDD
jgi:hypothetical protein